MNDASTDAKRALRQQVLARRDALDAGWRSEAGAAIDARLCLLWATKPPRSVLAYAGFGSEYDTDTFCRRVLDAEAQLWLPRVDRSARRLRLYRVEDPASQLVPGTWGIREPDPARCVEVIDAQPDWVLVPGVAFDTAGRRLGYGGGFYDRLLPGLTAALRVAAAFGIQVVERVPVEAHDLPVHRLVTEGGDFCCQAPEPQQGRVPSADKGRASP